MKGESLVELLSGIVKRFDSEKRFGFLTVEGSRDVFFHFNDGRMVISAGKQVELIRPTRPLKAPKPGDRLQFYLVYDQQNRPKASPWAYQVDWQKAERSITSRPRYRVVEQTHLCGEANPDAPSVIWEGTDLKDSQLEMVWSSNPNWDRPTFSCSDYSSQKWFEILREGNWIRCEDPRPPRYQ